MQTRAYDRGDDRREAECTPTGTPIDAATFFRGRACFGLREALDVATAQVFCIDDVAVIPQELAGPRRDRDRTPEQNASEDRVHRELTCKQRRYERQCLQSRQGDRPAKGIPVQRHDTSDEDERDRYQDPAFKVASEPKVERADDAVEADVEPEKRADEAQPSSGDPQVGVGCPSLRGV